MVFEIAPEMNGCTAPIIFRWPRWWMKRLPCDGLNAQSNTGRCSAFRSSDPSMVSCVSMGRIPDFPEQCVGKDGL